MQRQREVGGKNELHNWKVENSSEEQWHKVAKEFIDKPFWANQKHHTRLT